mgnify:CR=1 FL=1
MIFENAYDKFLQMRLNKRKGEAKRRLIEGHGHAEMLFLKAVWWTALGNLLRLHVERPRHCQQLVQQIMGC